MFFFFKFKVPVISPIIENRTHDRPSNAQHPYLQVQQHSVQQNDQQKMNEFLRDNMECMDTITSNKDLLALHNGAWTAQEGRDGMAMGQEKIVRAFGELMRNMARMKSFIRPSMCKPYGKQSESLQKSNKFLYIIAIART